MFDTLVVQQGRTVEKAVPYEKTVTHNYAPTTEQAKYLEELYAQAWKSVTDTIARTTQDNFLGATEFHRQRDHMNDKERAMAIFTLNGEKFEVEVAVRPEGFSGSREEEVELTVAVCEELSKQIARKVMIKAMEARGL